MLTPNGEPLPPGYIHAGLSVLLADRLACDLPALEWVVKLVWESGYILVMNSRATGDEAWEYVSRFLLSEWASERDLRELAERLGRVRTS